MADLNQLIRRLHDSPTRLVMAVTGGGSGAISALLEVPGASRTLLEAVVPYSAGALTGFLGARPEQFSSPRTARAMAMACFDRAMRYAQPEHADHRLAGLACTASLASDRPKQGPHRIHAAWQTDSVTTEWSLELSKGSRTRTEEERLAAVAMLNLAAQACAVGDQVVLDLEPNEKPSTLSAIARPEWRELLAGRLQIAPAGPPTSAPAPSSPPTARRVIFPGAFDPLHRGHRSMADLAAARLRVSVEFEISIINVDKPPLDFIELDRRGSQFKPGQQAWFTRAPTFAQKAALFPQATFVVGADTLLRIADLKYYGLDPARRRRAIDAIAAAGGRFLVFGRAIDGDLLTLSRLKLPSRLKQLCDEVAADQFRVDLSSTELRRKESHESGPL